MSAAKLEACVPPFGPLSAAAYNPGHMHMLLVKTTSLGDVVHNLPVASDIRRRHPDAVIDWLVEDDFAEIPRMHPAIRRVIPSGLRHWRRRPFAPATWRDFRVFREQVGCDEYDLILDTQGLIKSAWLASWAHGPRAGFAAEAAREPLAARFYQRCYAIPKNLHAVERNRWLAAAALGDAPDLPLDYGIRAATGRPAWLPARYAVLLTATARPEKLWPDENWLAVGRGLAGQGIVSVLPAGSAGERERASRLAAGVPGAIAAPAMGLAELAVLMACACAVIGLDTGLTHLAAALARPTLALFTATDPALTGVYAGATARNLGTVGAPPEPTEVLTAVSGLLAGAALSAA